MTSPAAEARTDVYVAFTDEPVARTRRLPMLEQDVYLRLDAHARPVGIDILAAARVEINGSSVEVDRE